MNEELGKKITALIAYVEERRFSSRSSMPLSSTKRALEKYKRDIETFGEDACDYYQRTGNLPGIPPKRKSYAYGAVERLIEGVPLEEVKTGLVQKVIL